MDDNLDDNESLIARIQQLEHERDELRKDIEQLCIQQAGPSYLVVATKMHFQRTAALEQEIDNFKKKLAACTRENSNLQEELSEAYRIKSQLADLHGAEVVKNMEAEKQVKFFQGCVAAAFAERDQSIMEAEKAKEKEELLVHKLNDLPKRVDELTSECLEQKLLNDTLRIDLAKQAEQNKTFRKVINKFYEIKQHAVEGLEDTTWDGKCACLLHDPADMWSYRDDRETSTSKYISALEEELEKVRRSVDSLQNKLHVGLEIENHLKKKVYGLEKKNILCDKMIKNGVSELVHFHYQQRLQIMNLLDEEKSYLESVVSTIEEKFRQLDSCRKQICVLPQRDVRPDENECRDVHITNNADPPMVAEVNGPGLPERSADGTSVSKALAQALHEKVAALLLLSQQEERHLLERNVNAALQKKMEELQRNLLQVTNEKVKALMELAQMKQEKQILQEKIGHEIGQGKLLAVIGEKRILTPERDGRLKNMLKKTYLRRWIGTVDSFGNDADAHPNDGNISSRRSNTSIDFARLKIENATLNESMESMEHLTSSIHRLRLSLVKVKESGMSEGAISNMSEALDEIITDAKLVKTALGSSLPVSWSAETEVETLREGGAGFEPGDVFGDYGGEKIDSVCAAGFEMVELLILAAQILKESTRKRDSGDAT